MGDEMTDDKVKARIMDEIQRYYELELKDLTLNSSSEDEKFELFEIRKRLAGVDKLGTAIQSYLALQSDNESLVSRYAVSLSELEAERKLYAGAMRVVREQDRTIEAITKERDGLRAECDKWKALVLTDQNKKNVYLENQLRRNQEGCSCPLPTFNGSPFDGIGYGCKLHGR